MASPENMNTTAAPTMTPTRVRGEKTAESTTNCWYAPWSTFAIPSVNDPNRAVAARTAVAIAMPLVIALVVFPTASSSVRIREPAGPTSPDISAMPCALSETGPKVSMATMTPTVVSRPQPARAMANSPTTPTPPSRNAANRTAAMITAVNTADSSPREMPDSTTVAAPVSDVRPTSWVGPVSYTHLRAHETVLDLV